MERIKHRDEVGRHYYVEVPDGCGHMADLGIRIGPPDLSELGLPVPLEVRLSNQLCDRGIITARDARRRPGDVEAALRAALKIDVQAVIGLYLEA